MAGYFLTFEGIDGNGKSTHALRLAEVFKSAGNRVVLTHEPGATPLGQRLRSELLSGEEPISDVAELLLFAADRAQHVSEVIRPALERGHVVISDRFADSTRAYQGFGRGVDRALLERAISLATGGLTPDLTILIDVELAEARARSDDEPDRLESEPDVFFERVRRGFLDLASEDPDRIRVVDGSGSLDATAAAILAAVGDRLPDLKQSV